MLSSFLLWSRLILTASDCLLLSASSGRLLLSAPSSHPLDRLDLDTYVLLHWVRESELNPMFFASLPRQGAYPRNESTVFRRVKLILFVSRENKGTRMINFS